MKKSRATNRWIAMCLSLVMMFSMIPFPVEIQAATAEHPDAVTITVLNEEERPIPNASVTMTVISNVNSTEVVNTTVETDANGVVDVITSDEFDTYISEGLTLTAVVTADGYVEGKIENRVIEANNKDYEIKLTAVGVEVTNVPLTYNGELQELLKVEAKDGDIITYSLNGGVETTTVPQQKDANTYSVVVKVTREGNLVYDETHEVVINPANITDISIEGLTVAYNETLQEIVKLNGTFEETDVVTWNVNGESVDTKEIPKRDAVGDYNVTLTVKRDNYNVLTTETVIGTITKGELILDDSLKITGLNGVYTGKEQPALIVENPNGYTLKYQLAEEGQTEANETVWVDEIPSVIDAGSYTVWVKAVKDNYEDKEVAVTPAESAEVPCNVYIAQMTQSLEFSNAILQEVTYNRENPQQNVYDFSVQGENLSGETIIYELVDATSNQVAEISSDGKLTVKNAGVVTVKVTSPGNKNYEETSIYATVTVKVAQDDLLNFDVVNKEYVLDTDGVASEEIAVKANDDNGEIIYSIDNTGIGLIIDDETGKVTVSDRELLAEAMKNTGEVEIIVTAEKEEDKEVTAEWRFEFETYRWKKVLVEKVLYQAASTSYNLKVVYDTAPEFDAVCEMSEPAETGWYNLGVPAIITPISTETYAVALDTPIDFEESVTITDSVTVENQNDTLHYIYLVNKETKKICAGIPVDVNVDNEKPDANKMSITFSELNFVQKIGEALGFYNPDVTITFTAEDTVSGIKHFDWTYTKEEGVSSINKDSVTKEVDVTVEGNIATATITIPAGNLTAEEKEQLHGKISFTATDKAGNESERRTEDYVVIVDTISPTREVTYTDPVKTHNGNHHYFNGDVEVNFVVTEANFYAEDVVIKLSKDGGIATEIEPTWASEQTSSGEDKHIGTYTISGDGDYILSMTYLDKSGNEMEPYVSDTITIDTTSPEVNMEFVHDGNVQKTVFTVKEHNFRPSDVVVTGTMKDILEEEIEFTADNLTTILRNAEWTKSENDTYVYEYDQYLNGIYKLTLGYTDITNWTAEAENLDFIIDHGAPEEVSIEFEVPLLEKVLNAITFGYYKEDVTVTFTAYDTEAGVRDFSWYYTKEENASGINVDAISSVVGATQDEDDSSKFTATITIPDTEEEQLRGYMAVVATDTYGNASEMITDQNKIIVVDKIAPEVSVSYSTASRTVGDKAYYSKEAKVKIEVTEANFYAEDVVVNVTKNGTTSAVTPDWNSVGDVHTGKFTLTEDGHYFVSIAYTDRSMNAKKPYTSNEIIVDTVSPVVNVEYKNTDVINVLNDRENHSRNYFADTQTAVVTIKEHNFNADEVEFMVTATDVSGKALDANVQMSDWTVDSTGDVHTITLSYAQNANYKFDIAYKDLATNELKDYTTDYFTVDKTKPANLSVSYSTSILETVLESLTFGFYNAKATVTMTAEDSISGVQSFLYSYVNADGVSAVNTELLNQAIDAANITYSEDGKKATASFDIPKMLIAGDNQFNGTVEFTATDRSDNESDVYKDTKRIVVDNIAPTAQVSYSEPVNASGEKSYYSGDISATVTITEANFYTNDVQVSVSKDGASTSSITPSWSSNGDVHTGTFTLSGDGDYVVTINYADKSSNSMNVYTSNTLVIDTDIKEPTYSINGTPKTEEGGAYKGEATIAFDFEDQNYDTSTIQLMRTRFDSVEDVTNEFIAVSSDEMGGSGSFTIPEEVGNDGIYVLSISMTDKANHTTESQMKFTINRYGSVYEYDEYLVSLIKDGGQYITITGDNTAAITEDLVITEYNADRILEDSLEILVTRDGESVDVDYTTSPSNINSQVGIGASGWYQYVYTIKASNFAEDGVYKIALTSAYTANDSENNESSSVPENSIDEEGNQILDTMSFTVDTKAPEIRNIVNMDEAIVDAQTLDVKYTIVDVGGLKSIEIIVNDEVLETIEEFGDSAFNYSGQFTLNESAEAQSVQIRAIDLAGNVTDTASEDFSTGDLYVFNNEVTVSTNALVRWYANTPLFWGTIGGAVALVGAVGFGVNVRRKKVNG